MDKGHTINWSGEPGSLEKPIIIEFTESSVTMQGQYIPTMLEANLPSFVVSFGVGMMMFVIGRFYERRRKCSKDSCQK